MERDLNFVAKTKLFLQWRKIREHRDHAFDIRSFNLKLHSWASKLDKESAGFGRLARVTPNRQITCISAAPPFSAAHSMKIEERVMTTIEKTPLGRLDQEGRLLNAVLKSPTTKPGRFGFRGDIALKFQAQLADEKRPPEFS